MNQQLAQFLLTADPDNTVALAEAQAHEVTVTSLIHRNTMNSLFAQQGIYRAFQIIAADDGHPWQDASAALLDSEEFNFIVGNPTGDTQIGMLDLMIAAGITVDVGSRTGVDVSAALAAIKPVILAIANKVTRPFENVTLEEVEYHRQEIVVLDGNTFIDRTLTLTIANSAESPVNVEVQHRFGNDENDLTPWHTVGNFINVHYKQQQYQTRINPNANLIREVRIVSPVTLGMSVS